MIDQLIHVNIVVSDAERSMKFYTEVLGARVVRDWWGESDTPGLALGISDGPFTGPVRVRVTDGFSSPVDSSAATLTVSNAAPSATLANSGPTPDILSISARAVPPI